jgi:cytochrome c oxidase subunit 2
LHQLGMPVPNLSLPASTRLTTIRARRRYVWLLPALAGTADCSGMQSALAPAGAEAERLSALFWWMAAGAVVVWLATLAVAGGCAWRARRSGDERWSRWLILGGGVAVPTVLLTVLLVYGLASLPRLVARAPEGSLQVAVHGEMWRWRVHYVRPDGSVVQTANEIRLPVGEPVQFRLSSDNVIHSFWIPSLAGKMDMIPGRTTYLQLRPTEVGIYRGACAEYCGASHARMNFLVEVMPNDAFERWLEHQRAPAAQPADDGTRRGLDVFLESGCNACHRIGGTAARGAIGPDLTHVGGRLSLGAAVLPNDAEAFARWVARTPEIKPGVHMPAFDMLPPDDLRALARYLESLK